MARFNYRLQGVLNLRLQQEEQAKSDFSEANRELNEQQEILNGLISRKKQYIEEGYMLRNAPTMDVQAIKDNSNAQEHMDVIIAKQKQVMERYEARFEMARIKLTRAMQERKMQEILKERAFAEFLEEQKQEEYKENDQRTSFTYGQKQKE